MSIPIHEAERLAALYGYDQIVIIARQVDKSSEPGHEHVTTFGKKLEDKKIAAQMGQYLKHKVMGWPACTHANSHAVPGSQGKASCPDCGIIMPDELNFWDFPDTEAQWPK